LKRPLRPLHPSSFIETQFPIARLSAESEAARMLAGDLEMIMLDANETFQQMQPT
jgi:hypothetical protein